MKKRFILSFVLLAVITTMLAACSNSNNTTAKATTTNAPTTTEAQVTTEAPTTEAPTTEAPTTAEQVTTTELEKTDPVLSLSSEDAITVVAGVSATLPIVTATDYDGTDLTEYVEVEDPAENGTLSNGTFTAKIAGVHELDYYVETEDGRSAEKTLTVTVTPANEETFDTTGYTDVSATASYATFKENFALGRKSPFYVIGDANDATYLTGTSEAISGNSLVIDFNKTAGSAANSVFLQAMNDYYQRGLQATYTVSFSYKILEVNGNYNDVYFGLSWDGSNGLNQRLITDDKCTVGEVYTVEYSFPGTVVPTDGNAYFFFFKLSGSNDPIRVAVDSFTIKVKELAQVTAYAPTAAELEAGFTWDFTDKAATSTNGEVTVVNTIENATVKSAIQGNDAYKANVLVLTNADDHSFSGLTSDNMTAGKVLTIEMNYYAVNGNNLYFIMMGTSGNPTQTIDVTDLGNGFYKATCTTTVKSGWYALNIYGLSNKDFEIYIGSITAKLSDPEPVADTTKTPNGYEEGYTFTQETRQFGTGSNTRVTIEEFDNNTAATGYPKMGQTPTKFTLDATSNVTMEWMRCNGAIVSGKEYDITFAYYIVSYSGGRFMYNFDNNVFLEVGTDSTAYKTTGYHEETITWTATRDVDFFSFYVPEEVSAVMYVGGVTVTDKSTGSVVLSQTSRAFGNETKGTWACAAYDNYAGVTGNPGMCSAPNKLTFTSGGDANVEWFRGNGRMEEGMIYTIKIALYVQSWSAGRLMYNVDNSAFLLVDDGSGMTAGYHEFTIEWTATKDVDFFSIYAPDGTEGVVYIGGVTVTLKHIPVTSENGYEVGYTFTQSTRQWGNKSDAKVTTTDYNAETDGTACVANEAMGTSPIKFTYTSASDSNTEWFQANGRIEEGCTYTITLTYYVESWSGGRFMYNFDNNVFLAVGEDDYMSAGFHTSTITWTATRDVDFFSFYIPGDQTTTGVVYIAGVTVELTKLAE